MRPILVLPSTRRHVKGTDLTAKTQRVQGKEEYLLAWLQSQTPSPLSMSAYQHRELDPISLRSHHQPKPFFASLRLCGGQFCYSGCSEAVT